MACSSPPCPGWQPHHHGAAGRQGAAALKRLTSLPSDPPESPVQRIISLRAAGGNRFAVKPKTALTSPRRPEARGELN
jgi:hypothetical protein